MHLKVASSITTWFQRVCYGRHAYRNLKLDCSISFLVTSHHSERGHHLLKSLLNILTSMFFSIEYVCVSIYCVCTKLVVCYRTSPAKRRVSVEFSKPGKKLKLDESSESGMWFSTSNFCLTYPCENAVPSCVSSFQC